MRLHRNDCVWTIDFWTRRRSSEPTQCQNLTHSLGKWPDHDICQSWMSRKPIWTYHYAKKTFLKLLSWQNIDTSNHYECFLTIDCGHVIIYIDDVCIFTDTTEEDIEVLNNVLKALHDLGLRVVYSKCMFVEKQIPFLGFLISQEGVTIDPQRIAAIKNYTAPKTKSEVRSFLGLTSHYRKYIKDFAKIARPLTLLTKKDAIVQWTPECQGAMNMLKEWLTEPPILATFNPNLPTQVHVDASHTALGAVLRQNLTELEERSSTATATSIRQNLRQSQLTGP